MNCSVSELRSKDVVSIETGCRLGCVSDVVIDGDNGCVVSITVYCGKGLGGFFGRGEEITVCRQDIVVIGDDTILVHYCGKK